MRWGLIISGLIVVAALVLAFGYISNYPGHVNFENVKAGFVDGLIHGIIAPVMLVVSTFTKFTMYEINNLGFLYNIGFLLGILLVWGSGARGTKNIVKNYYHHPNSGQPVPQQESAKRLYKEDINKISKMIEKKINKKSKGGGKSERSGKPKVAKDSLLKRIFVKKPKKKIVLKEKVVKKAIRVGKGKA
jgi:hypothetical protein